MHVSVEADRAVRAMVELAASSTAGGVAADELAQRQRIPVDDLLNVLAVLRREELITGGLAAGGRWRLERPATEISIADVIRAVDGPLADVAGVPPERVEYHGAATPLRDVWLSTRQALRRVLEDVSLAEVAAGQLPAHVGRDLSDPEALARRSTTRGARAAEERAGAAVTHLEGVELPAEDVVVVVAERPPPLALRLVYLVLGFGLFVTALGLMKTGAAELIPAMEGSVLTDNAWSTLGLGWLGACIVLSGSPIAASSLALLDGGAIDRTQSFTMLTGSRLGAAFVVLVVGVVYAVRQKGTSQRAPISIGILALVMTAATYLPGALIGYLLLDGGAFDELDVGSSPTLTSATDTAFGWAVDALEAVLPDWALFPAGLVVLLVGFQLFDRVLPSLGSEGLEERSGAWYTRKWPMFLLGCGVCLLTLSVSVALTLLVPIVAKGYLRRANTLPYIAGANITTLADTLVAAILLGNQDAVRVVVAVTVSVTGWTLLVLAVGYPLLRRACLGIARRALESRRRLGAFVALLLLVPVGLIAV